MNTKRPRLTENEFDYVMNKRLTDKGSFRTIMFSDPHGWFADLKALRCINKVLESNPVDEVLVNGDIVDMPYISKHTGKLYENGILNGYSEVKEIEYTKEQILAPLRASTDANIRIRIGNHDERITNPFNYNQNQSNRVSALCQHYNQFDFGKMLGLDKNQGWIYDPSDCHVYFDIFAVVHGLSMTKGTAAAKNINNYQVSGASGHTHRLQQTYTNKWRGDFVWTEMGCTRLCTQVEYFPTAIVPDWQQGFIDVLFYLEGKRVKFFVTPHIIIDGVCEYHGVVYKG